MKGCEVSYAVSEGVLREVRGSLQSSILPAVEFLTDTFRRVLQTFVQQAKYWPRR